MTRGTILFICTQCKKVFLAPDIEYGAMFFSVPMTHALRTLREHTYPADEVRFFC